MKMKHLLVIVLALSFSFTQAQSHSKTSPLNSSSKTRVPDYPSRTHKPKTNSNKQNYNTRDSKFANGEHVRNESTRPNGASANSKSPNVLNTPESTIHKHAPKLDQGYVNLPFNFDGCNTLSGFNGAYLYQAINLPQTTLIWDFVAHWRNCDRDYIMSNTVPSSFEVINESVDTLYVLYNSSDRACFSEFDLMLLNNPMASNMRVVLPMRSAHMRMIGSSFGAAIYKKREDDTFELVNQRIARPQEGTVLVKIR
jgi:hypothetical protein